MSMDQRDYYVERLRGRAGYVERSKFRRPASDYDPRYFPKQYRGSRLKFLRSSETSHSGRSSRTWHPLLIALVWVAILLVLYAVFKATSL
ncbi:MAG: hypothetical protein EPN61_12010 [Burkholderiaceae bacterium]|nr:MAG: hypothetical protein EPN61_12010 [Burkholderiaceae bacterium]